MAIVILQKKQKWQWMNGNILYFIKMKFDEGRYM